MLFRCRVTDKEVKNKCPVTTCMYNSKKEQTGCMQNEVMEDDNALAEHKGVMVKVIHHERREACKNINKVMLLDRYEKWLIVNKRSVSVEAFNVAEIAPVTKYPGNKWTAGLLMAAIDPETYKQFCKEKGVMLKVGIAELLSISDSDLKKLRRKGIPKT